MDYSQMVEDALKGVVQRAMQKAATDGLHGNHHFYVTFLTRFPGVELPDHLLERYPNDITIVLQHQFWDMEVGDEAFAVSLSFNKLPTRIHVPYDAITSFADPSVQFGLQFNAKLPEGMSMADYGDGADPSTVPDASQPVELMLPDRTDQDADVAAAEEQADSGETDNDAAPAAEGQGEVVSLDAFRKKQ